MIVFNGPAVIFYHLRYAYSLFFFNDTATTLIYTLSLHDALPISWTARSARCRPPERVPGATRAILPDAIRRSRSEEHTSELQSRENLVCRLLLEKKKKDHQLHGQSIIV